MEIVSQLLQREELCTELYYSDEICYKNMKNYIKQFRATICSQLFVGISVLVPLSLWDFIAYGMTAVSTRSITYFQNYIESTTQELSIVVYQLRKRYTTLLTQIPKSSFQWDKY